MKKLLPYIVLLLVVIAILVTIPFVLQTGKRRQQLADELTQRFGRKVVIGKMDLSLFPPSVRLSNIAVFSKDPSASNPDLQIDGAVAPIGLGDFFGSSFHPNSITLDHLSWNFHRRPNGQWDLGDWLTSLSQGGGSGSLGALHQINLHRGECHWMDAYAPVPQELLMQGMEGTIDAEHQTAHLNGTLNGAAVPVTFEFQGQGHFLSQAWSGDLKLGDENRQWTLHLDDASGHLSASGQSGQWRWDNVFGLIKFYGRLPMNVTTASSPVFLTNWKTMYATGESSTTISETSTLAGGLTEASAQIMPQLSGLSVQATIAAKDIPLSALCAPLGGCASLDGNLTAVVPHFQMTVASDTWSGMNGEGTIEIQDGRYHLPDASIQKLSRAHLMKFMKKKFNGFPEQGLVFSHLKAHGMMKGGLLMLDRSMVDAGDVRAALVGKVDPAHKGVDAMMRLQIRGSNHLELIPGKYIIGETGREQIQPIYGHLQGTTDEWMLRSVPNYKVPGAIKSQLQKSLSEK